MKHKVSHSNLLLMRIYETVLSFIESSCFCVKGDGGRTTVHFHNHCGQYFIDNKIVLWCLLKE